MKTILTLLLSLLCIGLTVLFTSKAVTAIQNSEQLYTSTTSSNTYEFQTSFLFIAFILIILAMVSLAHSIALLVIFYNNCLNIIKRRKDREIKNHLIEARYEKLYKDLASTNIYEEKQRLIDEFYNPTVSSKLRKSIKDLLDDIKIERTTNVTEV